MIWLVLFACALIALQSRIAGFARRHRAEGEGRVPEAGLMAAASLLGGLAGAQIAQRLPARIMRGAVVSYGVLVALVLLRR